MKKHTLITFLLIIYVFPFVFGFLSAIMEDTTWNPFDYARITDVDYKAVVVDEPGSKGKVVVTERLTYDIHAASKDNLFWELWRDLPEDYVDGVKVEYKVNSVKQIIDDEIEVVYTQSPKLYWDDDDYTSSRYGPGKWYHSKGPYSEEARQYECVLFYVDGLYREQVVFEIEYEMYNAALRYDDCSELYLSMYSEETIKHLNSFKGEILIKDEDMPRIGNYDAHTYGTNSNEFAFTESKTKNPGYHTFSFELNKEDLKFKPYNEYIEFALVSHGSDKHKFTDYASKNNYYYDDVLDELKAEQLKYEEAPAKYNGAKFIIFVIALIISIITIIKAFGKDKKMREKYNFYEPSMQIDFFREIPSNLDPHFAATLAFCKDKKDGTEDNNKDSYAAILLSLVRKGYVELAKIVDDRDWTFYNVKIVVKYKPINPISDIANTSLESNILNDTTNLENITNAEIQEPIKPTETLSYTELKPLTTNEKHYFDLIVRHSHGTEIWMRDFQEKISSDYQNTDTFVKNIEKSVLDIGINDGYFQKAKYKEPKTKLENTASAQFVWGIIIIILFNIISYQTPLEFAFGAFFIFGIALIISSRHLKKISKKYILLTQFGEDEYSKWRGLYNFLNSETLINERTVVEVKLWEQYLVYATAFGISDKVIKALNIRCPEIADQSSMLSNPYYRSRSFYSTSRSFRTSIRSASHVARSGGYGGFHGSYGYGGGGRGGGGGRRRTLIYITNKIKE